MSATPEQVTHYQELAREAERFAAHKWLLDQPRPTRCGPSHLCDSMSGCVHGLVTITTPHGPFVVRLQECWRGGRARVLVNDPELGPQVCVARFVDGERIAVSA